jgi:hypothetical protein
MRKLIAKSILELRDARYKSAAFDDFGVVM